MAGNKILLDTNIVTALLKGEENIADKIDAAEHVSIPVIVVGELEYGAMYSQQVEKNKANIKQLINAYPILSIDKETAEIYGRIKAALRNKGKPIPENDIWIAALTQQHSMVLITRDKHFLEVEGLKLEEWSSIKG